MKVGKMKKLVGIIGSSLIGLDPFHPRAWSGSSRRFFLECNSQDILARAFGVEVSRPIKYLFALKNYSRDRNKLIKQFLMDPGYRNALTDLVKKKITDEDMNSQFLQIGAIYNVPSLVKNKAKCYSYNDSNFSMSLNSPYFPTDISKTRIERTLQYERGVNNSLDKVFTMSEYARKSFITDYGVSANKVITIGGGINIDSLPESANNKDYSNGSILFIGIDFPRKGGFDVIKAFKIVREHFPKASLHIVGPHTKIPSVCDQPGVVWHGFLDRNFAADNEKLNDLLKDASLFVMPSLYEPFGIAPLEAMAHEIPCIVSNGWALPEVVPENNCGLHVSPGNWEELAEAFLTLLKSPSTLEKFGKAGRKHVEENFSWKKVVNRLKTELMKN